MSKRGIKQGYNLSLLLFNIFISNLANMANERSGINVGICNISKLFDDDDIVLNADTP